MNTSFSKKIFLLAIFLAILPIANASAETTTNTGNAESGNLAIIKKAIGGDATFDYNIYPSPSNAQITTNNGTGSAILTVDSQSTYYIAESLINGWTFTSASCRFENGDPVGGPGFNGSAAMIDVPIIPGQTTTCIFNNRSNATNVPENPVPTIASVDAEPVGSSGPPFYMMVNGSGFVMESEITLDGIGFPTTYISPTKLRLSSPIDPSISGSYYISVVNPGPGGGYSLQQPLITITGGTILQQLEGTGSIKVIKNTTGGNAMFSFTSNFGLESITTTGSSQSGSGNKTLPNLAPGSGYNITEVFLPTGWNLISASCDNGTVNLNAINVTAGMITTCTLVNAYIPVSNNAPYLTVNKILSPSSNTGKFDLQIDGATYAYDAGNQGTTGQQQFIPGSHTVSEMAGTATNLADYTVSFSGDCDANGNISLGYGDNKVCTITNTYSGSPQPQTTPGSTPTITSISPTSKTECDNNNTLTVNGTGFVFGGSTIQFDGLAIPTTYVSATKLTTSLSSVPSGDYSVDVVNSNGGTSNTLEFSVSATTTPVPTIESLSPISVNAGDSGFNLIINGTNFTPVSKTSFNNAVKTATYISDTQISIAISASEVAIGGSYPVTVTNPAPNSQTCGEKTSNEKMLTVNGQTNTRGENPNTQNGGESTHDWLPLRPTEF